MTTDRLAALMVALLRGEFGTVQLTYRRPVHPGKGPEVWSLEARGWVHPAPGGIYFQGDTLADVLAQLAKPPAAG